MAVKDPHVLDRLNALNTDLENATNTDNIENNISGRLFNILEGENSISLDSELYASLNDVTTASDIAASIGRIHFDAAITVNGVNIINTGNLPHGDTNETQNAINNITNSENELTSFEGNIANLKARFQENIQKLGNIRDEQIAFTGTVRNLPAITTEINNQQQLTVRIQQILRTISRIINEQNGAARPAVLNNLKTEFDGLDKTGITNAALLTITDITDAAEITIKQTDYLTLNNDVNNRIGELQHERELRNHINGLNTTQIHVQNGFLPFTDAETVASAGADATATQAAITLFENRITQLNNFETEIPNIRARYAEHKNRLNRILQLQRLENRLNTTHPGELLRRQREFDTVRDIARDRLLLGNAAYEPELPNTTIGMGETGAGVLPARLIHLDFVEGGIPALGRGFNGGARSFGYTLCDKNGNTLRSNGGRLEIQLEGGQTVNIRGITFDNFTQTMRINDLQVEPVEGLNFPLVLELNVRVRIHDNDTGLDIDHHKPIRLEITRPTLTESDRQSAYDRLMPPMNERITAEYGVDDTPSRYREDLENEAIWSILREGGNEAEVNEIYNNETRRNMLINRIRTALLGRLPLLRLAELQQGFRTDMTRENRDVPVQYLLGIDQFQNYIRQSIPSNLKDYASRIIRENANIQRNDILQEFLNFQTDIANNRIDNNDNLRALYSIPPVEEGPEGHPNTFFQRLFGRDSIQNNYTKFFHGRHAELNDLSLETEDGTIRYGVKVEVLGVNKIVATINIDGKEEPEIIDASSHDDLIEGILARENTKDGESLNKKLRCNIALAVLKAMVLMSPQKLTREIPPTDFIDDKGNTVNCDRMEAFVRGGNLRLRGGGIDGSRTRQNVTIFDEAQFKEIHDVDMLEDGIYGLSTQINTIMNATAQEYHEATSAMLKNNENRYVMRYNTAQRLRGGPIKRLWGRLVHGKTSNIFEIDNLSVNEAGKSVNIKLNKGLFTVSGEFDGQQYEYKGRNLGSILRKKINRKRVFDGVELAMVAAINEAFIQKLRKNHRVQTENFIIADMNDGKTGRTYVFDDAGHLSYLEIEDINLNPLGPGQSGRVDPNQVPAERVRCNEQERREFMQNPLLAGRLQREMRRRLALF